MENSEDFYLVLPSNSSMTYFPQNTTNSFTTHLAREIRLTGEWQVGIAEIHVPCTIIHIQESDPSYTFKLGSAKLKRLENNGICNFPYEVYDNVAQLAEEINNVFIVGAELIRRGRSKGGITRKPLEVSQIFLVLRKYGIFKRVQRKRNEE